MSPTIIVKTTTPRYIGLCLHVCLGSEGCGFYVAFCIASGGSTKRGLQPPWAQSFPQKFNGLKYNSKAFVSVNIYNFMSHHMVAQNKKKKEKCNNIRNKQQCECKHECANKVKLAHHLTQKVFCCTMPISIPPDVAEIFTDLNSVLGTLFISMHHNDV